MFINTRQAAYVPSTSPKEKEAHRKPEKGKREGGKKGRRLSFDEGGGEGGGREGGRGKYTNIHTEKFRESASDERPHHLPCRHAHVAEQRGHCQSVSQSVI
jgi:hypothetical protein